MKLQFYNDYEMINGQWRGVFNVGEVEEYKMQVKEL